MSDSKKLKAYVRRACTFSSVLYGLSYDKVKAARPLLIKLEMFKAENKLTNLSPDQIKFSFDGTLCHNR
jgi:hypothetical protein